MLIYTVQHMDGEEHTYIGRKAKKWQIYRKVSLAMAKQLRNGIAVYSLLVKIKEASVDRVM